MNKVIIVIFACSLTFVGLSATSQTNVNYQATSIDRA
jgi:hypothetical protein